MNFVFPVGIRLNLADEMLCLTDKVQMGLSGRRPPNLSNIPVINLYDQPISIMPASSTFESGSILQVQTLGESRCVMGANGDGWNGHDYVLAAFECRYTWSSAKLYDHVSQMDDREHGTSIASIFFCWMVTVQILADVSG